MSTREIDQSQTGGEVHRSAPGCGDPEPRFIIGQKITPEYVERLARAQTKIKDANTRDAVLAIMEILLSQESATDAVARVGS